MVTVGGCDVTVTKVCGPVVVVTLVDSGGCVETVVTAADPTGECK